MMPRRRLSPGPPPGSEWFANTSSNEVFIFHFL
jgi:hypothetical protein